MAAYRTASRLFAGSHIPWLGMGIECLRTNHLHLALQYIRQAQELCPQEPRVPHGQNAIARHCTPLHAIAQNGGLFWP